MERGADIFLILAGLASAWLLVEIAAAGAGEQLRRAIGGRPKTDRDAHAWPPEDIQ